MVSVIHYLTKQFEFKSPDAPPWWKTKIPIRLTKNPKTDTTKSLSCLTSGGWRAR